MKYTTNKTFINAPAYIDLNTKEELINVINNNWSKYGYKVEKVRLEPKETTKEQGLEMFAVMVKFNKRINFIQVGVVNGLL